MKYLSQFILTITGWKYVQTTPKVDKSIIVMAPHTSNWDFIIGQLSYYAMGNKDSYFLIKKEWLAFPFGLILKPMGGIGVDRTNNNLLTTKIAKEFSEKKSMHIGITPEGTRQRVTRWKKGFYHIALQANIPIQLAYIDYAKKECGITKVFMPTGNEDADIKEIRKFYNDVTPRHPKQFHKLG